MKKSSLKQLPDRGNHNCFGCSPGNPSGLRMQFHTDGKAVYSWIEVPDHLGGWGKLVHGGVITTMLDEVMGWAAVYFYKSVVLTKSITVDFLKPVLIKTAVRVEGRVAQAGTEREAVMEGFLFDAEENLCSRARGVFALLPPEIAKTKGLIDPSVPG
jgi:uncharacterized protein (TIGR00369 family)